MGFNVVDFVKGYVIGLSDNTSDEKSDITKIDELPTIGEIIIGDGWSIKIKISDDIDLANSQYFYHTYDTTDGSQPYMSAFEKRWTVYFCVYKSNQCVFGNAQRKTRSKYWSFSVDGSDIWNSSYSEYNLNITNIKAEKTSEEFGLTGVNIIVYFEYETSYYTYDKQGNILGERHTTGDKESASSAIIVRMSDFYCSGDYQQNSDNIISFGLAVTNCDSFEIKIYDT